MSAPRVSRGRRRDSGSFCLPEQLSISGAGTLQQELLARLEHAPVVQLDATAVREIDTAALQLLVAFVRDRREAGRETRWSGASDTFEHTAGLLGLKTGLALPAMEAK